MMIIRLPEGQLVPVFPDNESKKQLLKVNEASLSEVLMFLSRHLPIADC